MIFSDGLPNYSQPLYRPPSEGNSLIFQITEGCSWNNCSFCGMYISKKFRIKPVEDVKAEIDNLAPYIKERTKRVFLADGDAAVYPTEGLIEILDYLNEKLPKLQRVSVYAGPHALMKKKIPEWEELHKRKLTLLFFGLESGNDEVLKHMNKGMKAGKVLEKAKRIADIGIDFSVMVILGGGGRKLSEQHMLDSAKWISELSPKYASLLTLFLRRKRDYFDSVEKPTMGSLLEESKIFVSNVKPKKGIIFRSNHVSNLVPLKGTLPKSTERLIAEIDEAIKYAKKTGIYDNEPELYEEF